jgi:hypothetical protein
VVIRRGDRLLLNGQELVYEGKVFSWKSHPLGVVIDTASSRYRLVLVIFQLPYNPALPGEPPPEWVIRAAQQMTKQS